MPHSELDYHLAELSIANDNAHPAHNMPVIERRHKTILDVGCGMGQTLLASRLPAEVESYGIDCDSAAIAAGQQIAPANVHLTVGTGEHLNFPDAFFDLVICRVAIYHMCIRSALSEMYRVLAPGGDLWLSLLSFDKYKSRVLGAFKLAARGRFLSIFSQGFIGLNSIFFNGFGKQMKIAGRTETFQTVGGIRRALAQATFEDIRVQHQPFFVVEARKPLSRKPL